MLTEDELLEALGGALDEGGREPPAERVHALRAAVATAATRTAVPTRGDLDAAAQTDAGAATARGPGQPARPGRVAIGLSLVAAAAVVAMAFALGGVVLGDPAGDEVAGGDVEFETVLGAPVGGATADVTGIKTGIGRIVELRTDDLPILADGGRYEVWFVGPGDSPGSWNRISAGTFHPDPDGRSNVDLTAAVDPALYPRLSVTAEPGDGDPLPGGPEVLGATLEIDG